MFIPPNQEPQVLTHHHVAEMNTNIECWSKSQAQNSTLSEHFCCSSAFFLRTSAANGVDDLKGHEHFETTSQKLPKLTGPTTSVTARATTSGLQRFGRDDSSYTFRWNRAQVHLSIYKLGHPAWGPSNIIYGIAGAMAMAIRFATTHRVYILSIHDMYIYIYTYIYTYLHI